MKRCIGIAIMILLYSMVGCVEYHERVEMQVWRITCMNEDYPYNTYGLQYLAPEKLSLEEEIKLCEEN